MGSCFLFLVTGSQCYVMPRAALLLASWVAFVRASDPDAASICNRDCVVEVDRLLAAQRLLQQQHIELKRRYFELALHLLRSPCPSLGGVGADILDMPLEGAAIPEGGISPTPLPRRDHHGLAAPTSGSRVLLRQESDEGRPSFIGPLLPGQYRKPIPGAGAPHPPPLQHKRAHPPFSVPIDLRRTFRTMARVSTIVLASAADPCEFADDGICDFPLYCPVGDYEDCGTKPGPTAAPTGFPTGARMPRDGPFVCRLRPFLFDCGLLCWGCLFEQSSFPRW